MVHLWIYQLKQDTAQHRWGSRVTIFLLVCEEYLKDIFSLIFCIYILYLFICSLIITILKFLLLLLPGTVDHGGLVCGFLQRVYDPRMCLKALFSSSPSPRPSVNRYFVLNDQAEWYLFTIPGTIVRLKVLGVSWPSGTRKSISDFSLGWDQVDFLQDVARRWITGHLVILET